MTGTGDLAVASHPSPKQRIVALARHLSGKPRVVLAGQSLLVALYLLLWWITSTQKLNATDFDVFFLPSARVALDGHPLLIYTIRYQTNYPNANGPLAILPLTILAWVAAQLHWLNNAELRRGLVMTVFSLFALLMAREGVLAADRLLGAPLTGLRRLLAYGVFALTPELWHSMLLYGHIEHPIMLWLLLACVRMLAGGKTLRGGVLMGLTLLARSAAILYLLPLVLVLLFRGKWRASLLFSVVTAATVVVGLLPFWLADAKDVLYSLVTFRGTLVIGGGSFWGTAIAKPFADFALHYDSVTVILASLLLTTATLLLRRDLTVSSRDIYLLLALSGLCLPLLLKTLWPYYFLEAYILLAVWWVASARGLVTRRERIVWIAWAALPLGAIGCAQFGEYALTFLPYNVWTPPWSLAMFVATSILVLGAAVTLWVGGAAKGQGQPAVSPEAI